MGPTEPHGQEADEPSPPPTPFERARTAPEVAPEVAAEVAAEVGPEVAPGVRAAAGPVAASTRRGGGRTVRTVLAVLTVVAIGAVVAIRVGEGELPGRSGTSEGTREAALLALLEDVDAAEQVMLGFNEEVDAVLLRAGDPEAALVGIAAAAADAVELLAAPRSRIVAQDGDRVLDEVRIAYLPHLDAWVEHLALLADAPEVLLDQDRLRPSILLINATAVAFKEALEQLIAEEPGADVVALAEEILDQGFRGAGTEATL
jgi:hypothetical protein